MRKKDIREPTRLTSIRLPMELYEKAGGKAASQGMAFNTFVVNTIRHAVGETDKSAKLLEEVAKWVKANYPPGKSFPDDVTLLTFHHIRDDRKLRKLYDQIVLDSAGKKNYDALVPLHKGIGLLVKTLLNAKVKGRSLELDPKENLIKTYSLLTKQTK
ncbi:MAG: hypothetical protein WAX69_13170 [Victivallales bacterium]